MTFRAGQTYRAEFEIRDAADELVELDGAEVTYVLAPGINSDTTLLERTDTDPRVKIEPNDRTGIIRVRLTAGAIADIAGKVVEELRVSAGSFDEVPVQRPVYFGQTVTDPR